MYNPNIYHDPAVSGVRSMLKVVVPVWFAMCTALLAAISGLIWFACWCIKHFFGQ